MTREIPEIVDDNIVSSRILLMTKLTKRIPRVDVDNRIRILSKWITEFPAAGLQ
jgi:hypothetical protein